VDRLIGLILLRWRMDLRGLRRTPERLAGLLLLVPLLALSAAFATGAVYFGARSLAARDPDLLLPLASVLATAVGIFWMVSPMLTGLALSETHDLTRLLIFPIPFWSLVASSLLANLLQPLVLAKMPVVVGLALGLSSRPALLPLTLAGVALSFVFMLAAVQLSSLLLMGLARSRRFQDVSLFLGIGLGFVLSIAPLALLSAGPRPLRLLKRLLLDHDLFALSPFAWGVRAAVHAGHGDVRAFALYSLAALGAIAVTLALSTAAIARIHRGELDLGHMAGRTRGRPARMRFSGPLGALIEKDLRVAWRDPALKASLFMGLVSPLLFLFFMTQAAGGPGPTAVLGLATVVGLSVFGTNTFGLERRGIGLLMSFPVPRWRILVAKNVASITLRLPSVLTVLVASALLAPPDLIPATATVAIVGLLISAGVDNYASILFPLAAPEPGRPPGAAGSRGLGTMVLSALLLALAMLTALPFVLLAWLPRLFSMPWLWVVSLPLALAGAGAVYAMLIAGAEKLLLRREPEVLERILWSPA
jgi:ABC-2 type transport system permease protein